MRFHHAILSLSLGHSKDLDGWRLTKKTVTYTETEYFCSCLQAQGAYSVSPRFLLDPQIETKSNPSSFRLFPFINAGAEFLSAG